MAKKTPTQPTEVKLKSHNTPPETQEELRELLIDITRGHSDITLGSKAREALGQILDLKGSPDLLSITTLAAKIGTNPSTITRLARSLGYESFAEFQKALFATQANGRGAFYIRQAQTALSSGDLSTEQSVANLCHENQLNIDRFVESFDAHSFDEAVNLIANAQRVTVFGIRQFHSLAAFLTYGLRLIRSDVSVLDANSLGSAEELGAMATGDVCIVASVSPYSNQVVSVAQTAAERGLNVIAITDRANSPLVTYSKTAIFVSHESSFISNSITSFFAVVECLVNAVAAKTSDASRDALLKRQKFIEQLEIEDR